MATFSIRASAGSATPSVVSGWTVRLLTACVWALLAGSVTYWVLQWPQAGTVRDGKVVTIAGSDEPIVAPAATGLNRALGAMATGAERQAAPALSSRLSLVGVVRAGSRDGAALIAVDGKAARAVRVGAEVEPGVYLLALEPRRASLGPDPKGAETVSLELPKPKAP